MVQRTRTEIIIWGIVFRILSLPFLAVASFYLGYPFIYLVEDAFKYNHPGSFFVSFYYLELWALGIVLSFCFWSIIVFGLLGRKTDYIFSATISLFVIGFYVIHGVLPIMMYTYLFGSIALGIFIGYLLKQVRLKWFG